MNITLHEALALMRQALEKVAAEDRTEDTVDDARIVFGRAGGIIVDRFRVMSRELHALRKEIEHGKTQEAAARDGDRETP